MYIIGERKKGAREGAVK